MSQRRKSVLVDAAGYGVTQEEFQAVGTFVHRSQVHTVIPSQLQNQKALGPALEPR